MKRVRAVAVLGTIGVASLFAWSRPYGRDAACRALTRAEHAVTHHTPLSRAGAPAKAPPDPDRIVHVVHDGKPGPGYLPSSARSVALTARLARATDVDVSFTSDLVPYLGQDDELGVALGSGVDDAFSRRTSAELDSLTFRDGTRPLRLEAFLRGDGAAFDLLVVDLKTSRSDARAKALALAKAIPDALRPRLAVISTGAPLLTELRRLLPGVSVAAEGYGALASWASGFDLVSVFAWDVAPADDWLARRLGLRRMYWTAYTRAEHAAILALHPDLVIIDLSRDDPPALPAAWRRAPGAARAGTAGPRGSSP